MILSQKGVLQQTASNFYLNIPKQHKECLGMKKGDVVLITTNIEKKEITLKKVEV